MKNTIIIGNGISGITLARHLRKQGYTDTITVISDETPYFFSRTALMYVYMGHMPFENTKPYEDWFWKKNKIDLVFARVDAVDFSLNTLHLSNKTTLVYHNLVFAVGSKPNFFNWQNQNIRGVQGLFSYQDLQQMEENTQHCKHAVVAGGGLIGIEMVEMLLSRNIPVTYLVREFKFWNKVLPNEEADMIGAHIKEHGVNLRLGNEIHEIKCDADNRITKVIAKDGEEMACDFAGICIGVSPNIAFLRNTALDTDRGILVNSFFETNIENVYAIGDCAQFTSPAKGRLALEQMGVCLINNSNLLLLQGIKQPYGFACLFCIVYT